MLMALKNGCLFFNNVRVMKPRAGSCAGAVDRQGGVAVCDLASRLVHMGLEAAGGIAQTDLAFGRGAGTRRWAACSVAGADLNRSQGHRL